MPRRQKNSIRSKSVDQSQLLRLEKIVNQLALRLDAQNAPNKSFSSQFSSEVLQVYLIEYEQCMESYRHTYETIWQAGSIFAAISAAVVAFSSSSIIGNGSIPPLIQVIAPLPVLFWYHGIYRPMNKYGELRNDRLVELEGILNDNIVGLQMNHYHRFSRFRKGETVFKRILKFKWLWRPRVHEIITIFGFIISCTEIYLVWIHYLSLWHF